MLSRSHKSMPDSKTLVPTRATTLVDRRTFKFIAGS